MKYLGVGALVLLTTALGVMAWAWQSVDWYPPVLDVETQCHSEAQPWDESQPLKVVSFNVQYLAGKNYVFFYDVADGPDTQPSEEDLGLTLERVADIIRSESADIVLLQELNDADDSRTHYQDQLALLQQQLGEAAYPCEANAHYWKAGLVLHPKILGPVSMKLTTLSRYPMTQARRHQLPYMHQDSLTRRFYFQRAILETRMISQQGRSLALLNTHFDAWGDGSDLMPAQVGVAMNLFQRLEREQIPWIIGGDFNLLPPDEGRQWHKLEAAGTADFDRETALAPLYEQFGAIPSRQHLIGEKPHLWYTHFPNDPRVEGPDRTIDYLFYSHHWQLQKGYVRQHDTLDVSDHLPVVGQWRLQEPKTASLH